MVALPGYVESERGMLEPMVDGVVDGVANHFGEIIHNRML